MGFRTYRNNPLTTKCRVGKMGAGVPRPWSAKRAKESRSTGRPAATNSTPKTLREDIPSSGAPTCHRQIRQGTEPATIPGAMTRNIAEPRMGCMRLIQFEGFSRTHIRPLQINPRAPATHGHPEELLWRRSPRIVIKHSGSLVETACVPRITESELLKIKMMAELVAQ